MELRPFEQAIESRRSSLAYPILLNYAVAWF
jgi:hypothetical protein